MSDFLGCFIGFLIVIIFFVTIMPFLVIFAWHVIVPDVFRGMVENGLLPTTITWWQGLKISLLMGFLTGVTGASSRK